MKAEKKWILFVSIIFAIIIFMADFSWGDLPKSQISDQLISEAIDEAILAHEADPEAHLGDGESLEQHKINGVIDHPAESIVPDKFSSSNIRLYVGTNGVLSSFVDNVSSYSSGFFAAINQSSPLTLEGTLDFNPFIASDWFYNDGDVVIDFVTNSVGSSGTWLASVFLNFAKIEMKSGNVRVGYWDGSWHYSSWVAASNGDIAKWRVFYDSVNEEISFIKNGVLFASYAYTLVLEDDAFMVSTRVDRGSSSTVSIAIGNVYVGFDTSI